MDIKNKDSSYSPFEENGSLFISINPEDNEQNGI